MAQQQITSRYFESINTQREKMDADFAPAQGWPMEPSPYTEYKALPDEMTYRQPDVHHLAGVVPETAGGSDSEYYSGDDGDDEPGGEYVDAQGFPNLGAFLRQQTSANGLAEFNPALLTDAVTAAACGQAQFNQAQVIPTPATAAAAVGQGGFIQPEVIGEHGTRPEPMVTGGQKTGVGQSTSKGQRQAANTVNTEMTAEEQGHAIIAGMIREELTTAQSAKLVLLAQEELAARAAENAAASAESQQPLSIQKQAEKCTDIKQILSEYKYQQQKQKAQHLQQEQQQQEMQRQQVLMQQRQVQIQGQMQTPTVHPAEPIYNLRMPGELEAYNKMVNESGSVQGPYYTVVPPASAREVSCYHLGRMIFLHVHRDGESGIQIEIRQWSHEIGTDHQLAAMALTANGLLFSYDEWRRLLYYKKKAAAAMIGIKAGRPVDERLLIGGEKYLTAQNPFWVGLEYLDIYI